MTESFERIIRPNRAWLRLDVGALLRYRDLLFLLVRRDFVSRYQQTVLGPAWFILQPLITTLALTAVIGRVLGAPTDGIPPFMFYLSGTLGWSYFANVLGATGNTFGSNTSIFTKVYFPRLILPLSAAVSNLLAFAVQAASFLAIYFIFLFTGKLGEGPHVNLAALLALPLLLALSGALALGTGLLMSALSAKYRDLQMVVPFVVQIWMFASPVIYPLSQLGPTARRLAALNPMTSVVTCFRLAFFGVGKVNVTDLTLSATVTVLILAGGIALFQRSERTFTDTV